MFQVNHTFVLFCRLSVAKILTTSVKCGFRRLLVINLSGVFLADCVTENKDFVGIIGNSGPA